MFDFLHKGELLNHFPHANQNIQLAKTNQQSAFAKVNNVHPSPPINVEFHVPFMIPFFSLLINSDWTFYAIPTRNNAGYLKAK
jgi:endo-1,4-beta-D-glucanase Y